jgi:monofunctional biosynthetic peptidoglycan transglycosylase
MKGIGRWLLLAVLAILGLQLYFVLHIAALAVLSPGSTAFQRSEAWGQLRDHQAIRWRQEWVPYDQISDHLKRAVIASEDADFIHHGGVEWDAIEKARLRNAQAEARAARKLAATSKKTPASTTPVPNPKVVGGSTITQQLAKNLFLSGERTLLRKGEELVLSFALEQLLSKRRIMELYLNSVEWGNGVFGAEAAAQHYFRKPAAALTPGEAARLAVMLPRPKYFEKLPQSGYLANRSATIAARMGQVAVP